MAGGLVSPYLKPELKIKLENHGGCKIESLFLVRWQKVNQTESLKKHTDLILEATKIPKSVSEISEEYQIPLWTVYRRIRELRQNNMVEIAYCTIRNGRKKFLYRNRIVFSKII